MRKSLADFERKNHGGLKELCSEAKSDLELVLSKKANIGDMLVNIENNKYQFPNNDSRLYWERILSISATEIEDILGLFAVIKSLEITKCTY